jgi:hypothetical protein
MNELNKTRNKLNEMKKELRNTNESKLKEENEKLNEVINLREKEIECLKNAISVIKTDNEKIKDSFKDFMEKHKL